MTAFPEGMRLAQPGDERRIFDLFVMAHAENGYGDMDIKVVQEMIRRGTERDAISLAIIDGPERIEAVIGLQPRKAAWYNSDAATNWYWSDLLLFVHPLHRRSRHAARLFQYAKWFEENIHMPVVLELLPRGQFAEKDRLFSRFGKRIGAAYLIGASGDRATNNARH